MRLANFGPILIGKPEFKVDELFVKKCCDEMCFKKISHVAIEACRDRMGQFHSETKKNQFVLDYMRDHAKKDELRSVLYTVCGEEVCELCWRLVYGIRYNKFKTLKDKFADGAAILEHGLTGRLNTRESTIRLLEWMRSFFSKVGDSMPMSEAINLPSCLSRMDVYELAKCDLTQGELPCPSSSYMYEIWRKEFPQVKIPKVTTYHDMCVCIRNNTGYNYEGIPLLDVRYLCWHKRSSRAYP